MKHASDKTHDELKQLIRDAGLRVTLSRVSTLEFLRKAKSPLSHNDVAEQLEAHALDRVTVYRNLLDFVRVGLARKIDVGDHVWRFELNSHKAKVSNHHSHFICTDCGIIECLPNVELKTANDARMPKAFRKRQVEVQIKGLCDDCD